jgi:hypothetical protein
VPVGLTVQVGLPWWAITAIATAIVVVCALGLIARRPPAVRAVAAIFGLEGVVIAIAAPFAMSDSNSSGSGMAGASVSDRVIHVIEHAPAADMKMQGDVETFWNFIYDGMNAKKVGHDQGLCIHFGFRKTWECVWSTLLPGGQITTEGTGAEANAITGGSGAYANARGWVFVKTHNKAGTQFDEFFHVTG